jgi:hypothetical protein
MPTIPLVCGFLAMGLAATAMISTLRQTGWNLSALPRVDANTKLAVAARAADPGFHVVHPGAYDGQFYWAVAVDPLALGRVHEAVDKASYRYAHPLYGWLGWLFSAGRARAVPAALAAIALASMFVAAAVAATLGLRRGRSGWEGLFVALNIGLISAAAHDLAEPLAVALLLGAVAAYVGSRNVIAWLCLALLPLAKEPLIVMPLAVVVWELSQHRVGRTWAYATAAIPALLWWTYTRIHLGAWFTSGDSALGPPLAGWWRTLFGANVRHEAARGVAVAILVSLILVIVLAAARALRRPGPVELSFVGLAAIAACLAPNATLAFTTALRSTAFLVVLIPFVIAAPQLLPRSDRPIPASP